MGIDASLSLEKYCFSLVFPICVFESVGFTKKTVARRCQLIQAGSEGKWVTGPGLRLHHVVNLPQHMVMLVCYRSVR